MKILEVKIVKNCVSNLTEILKINVATCYMDIYTFGGIVRIVRIVRSVNTNNKNPKTKRTSKPDMTSITKLPNDFLPLNSLIKDTPVSGNKTAYTLPNKI